MVIEFLLVWDSIIQFEVSASQVSYLLLDIHMSIEFSHFASSGISPVEEKKIKLKIFKLISQCVIFMLSSTE